MQMNNILLPPINIPCTLFETISLFDDFSADDMQYGDMVEQEFLRSCQKILSGILETEILKSLQMARRFILENEKKKRKIFIIFLFF